MKSVSYIATLILSCFLLSSCSNTHELAPEWRPLEEIVEGDLPFISDTATTTLGTRVFTVDLDDWLQKRPVNSDEYRALLMHERVHAQRQLDAGLTGWLFNYINDEDFRWEEEKLGWEQEIRYLRSRGKAKPAEYYAVILSSKYDGMVSYEEALRWVREVLSRP